jgi:hypothetical protein
MRPSRRPLSCSRRNGNDWPGTHPRKGRRRVLPKYGRGNGSPAGSILSLVAIVPWLNTVVPGAKTGAALDALTLIALVAPRTAQIMAAL